MFMSTVLFVVNVKKVLANTVGNMFVWLRCNFKFMLVF